VLPARVHARQVADKLSAREKALRELPLPYSLALRLRAAGVAPQVICEYLAVEPTALEGLYRLAEAKLAAASHREPDEPRESPPQPQRSPTPPRHIHPRAASAGRHCSRIDPNFE
jgi:hypothetical protein